jgi:ABC-type molybdate transport system permease subunit
MGCAPSRGTLLHALAARDRQQRATGQEQNRKADHQHNGAVDGLARLPAPPDEHLRHHIQALTRVSRVLGRRRTPHQKRMKSGSGVAFLTWRVLYQPIGGGLNLVLTSTGIWPDIVDWLGQRSTAMPSVIAASVWRGFPFWFISILRRCRRSPRSSTRPRVGGATVWQRFRYVTLPGIRQVVIIVTLLSSIWTANSFENVWLLTQGGPSDATMVFPVLAYFGMQTQRIGEAAAVSVAMLPVLVILVFAATAMMQRDEHE